MRLLSHSDKHWELLTQLRLRDFPALMTWRGQLDYTDRGPGLYDRLRRYNGQDSRESTRVAPCLFQEKQVEFRLWQCEAAKLPSKPRPLQAGPSTNRCRLNQRANRDWTSQRFHQVGTNNRISASFIKLHASPTFRWPTLIPKILETLERRIVGLLGDTFRLCTQENVDRWTEFVSSCRS